MYMPGRLRTASRPFKTLIELRAIGIGRKIAGGFGHLGILAAREGQGAHNTLIRQLIYLIIPG